MVIYLTNKGGFILKLKDIVNKITVETSFHPKEKIRYVYLDTRDMQHIDDYYEYEELQKLSNDKYFPF